MSSPGRKWFLLAAVSGALGLAVWANSGHSKARQRMRSVMGTGLGPMPALATRPELVQDPLLPRRPARLVGERDTNFQGISAKAGSVEPTLYPSAADRERKPAAQRGGIDPCNSPDAGFGIYDKWRWGGGAGKLLLPLDTLDDQAGVDAIFHFAGYELARKEVTRAEAPFAFLGVAFPSGGLNYRRQLSGPDGLTALKTAVRASLKRIPDAPKNLRHIGLAAWSAGYDGVGVLLSQSKNADEVEAVVLLDGLHASRQDEMAELQLKPFIDFARRAARGERFMFVSYSSIPTDRYASTHETGRRLIRLLGGEPLFVEREDAGGLELKEMFSKGSFHARGYRGGGELDHCAHLMLYPMVLEALQQHWH